MTIWGGIDVSDQMLYQYLEERRSTKQWKKVALNIMSRMVLNAYILYKQNSDNPGTRLDFILNIIEELSREWIRNKNVQNSPTITGDPIGNGGGDAGASGDFLEKLPLKREKNCSVCSATSTKSGGKRKKTTFVCKRCKKGLHPLCLPHHICVTAQL
uniref:PiggyBac transposable element-derived protein domain-containing protein n=1 Tax=Homalodisca liturata TaxID=320908 RepID=A0A1B6IER3_9HEMI